MFTTKQYIKLVDRLVKESYNRKPYRGKKAQRKKSEGIRWGKLAEPALIEVLKSHPNYSSHEVQARFKPVDRTSCIDVVLYTKTNQVIYIPVVKDLWKGTAQCDRLEKYYYQWKGGFWDNHNVCCIAAYDYKERLERKFAKGTVKEIEINKIIKEMADAKILHNVETLWNHIGSL